MNATTGLLLDDFFTHHVTADGHPESPARLLAVKKSLAELGEFPSIPMRRAKWDEVARCHDPRYIEGVLKLIAEGEDELAGGDVSVSKESGEVALCTTGGVLNAVDAVLEGLVANAFCAVRPPGHHARPAAAMGFCLFNHVALAARHAQRQHGLERVAIVDWDVHHGNGTQEIFYADDSVLFFSTHQSPWYPGSGSTAERGEGAGEGFTLNCPLPAGAGRKEVVGAMEKILLPALKNFRPELILISAGFDSRVGDPLGQLRLTDADFSEMTRLLLDAGGGRLVSVLEGGYSLSGLASAARAHVGALSGKAHFGLANQPPPAV